MHPIAVLVWNEEAVQLGKKVKAYEDITSSDLAEGFDVAVVAIVGVGSDFRAWSNGKKNSQAYICIGLTTSDVTRIRQQSP